MVFSFFSFSHSDCVAQERTPPLIDDFLYICDGAYVKRQLTQMEMDVFRTIGYDLGIPLSYRFLRRYARVSVMCDDGTSSLCLFNIHSFV